jgi:antitoxin component of RelBE/YafQ-DinJ toxin-antitoxin module
MSNKVVGLCFGSALLLAVVVAILSTGSPDLSSESHRVLGGGGPTVSAPEIESGVQSARAVVDDVRQQQESEGSSDAILGGIVPPDEVAHTALRQAVRANAAPLDLVLPSSAAWSRFVDVWDRAGSPVRAAEAKRHSLGKSLARERFQAGKYEEVLFDESQRVNGGFSTDTITRLRHPDEWVSLKMLYREGGGQAFHVVRIMPGEVAELDDLSLELRLAEAMRLDAMRRLLPELRKMN